MPTATWRTHRTGRAAHKQAFVQGGKISSPGRPTIKDAAAQGFYRTQPGLGWSLCRSLFCPFCETPRKFDELREQAYTFAARIFVKKHRCNFSVPLHYGIYLSPVSQLTLANGVWWRGAGSVRISGFFRIEESLDRAQRGQSWGKGDKDGINQITKSVTINKNYERCTKTIRVGAA